ncbi:MAG: TlyA family RNA methyltransferase [Oligoflexales bacterium]|nr:TlyA family RNA methyltransferase [Oligoflexales bacterium]
MKEIKSKKVRVDQLLVEKNLAEHLKEASALIMAGKVVVNDQRIDKTGQLVDAQCQIRIKGKKSYVSRGGDKLASAIRHFKLEKSFEGKTVLDIGASTGGFTDCALKHGAKQVTALDVGANQLDWSLRVNPQVNSLESTDIRSFDASTYPAFDWILADISFNGFARLAPHIVGAGSPQTLFLLLVKPQFELPSSQVPKGGVITQKELREEALSQAISAFEQLGLKLIGSVDSGIKGRSGNQEIFILLQEKPQDHP